ncbi:IclR family transcriptional regulator [Gordonia sp. KTR9]|uniref:IclR family transcriptional regulator n=1 Tax=Gordonia sp. KTR9 TaxID=337191 RepID=UPI00027DE65F|nr:IclR family transcriptional regulator [Gordonia sp. KTR9]AFR49812.1 Transcriptional regulator [Gordonia sp. KTR9]
MSAVTHAFRVFEAVSQWQPVGVSALASALDMSKSTAQRALRSLAEEGWIEPTQSDSTKWTITTKALVLGSRHSGTTSLRELTRPTMKHLLEECGETVHLSLRDGRHMIAVEILETSSPVRTHAQVGDRFPLHATASGIAVMASMNQAESSALLTGAPTLERLTANTPTSPDDVEARVEAARRQGYAVTDGTRHEGISAIAAAILDRTGQPVAALSISAPSHRLAVSDHVVVGESIKNAAAQCSGIYLR